MTRARRILIAVAGAACLVVPAADASVAVKGVDTSGFPVVRVSVLTSEPSSVRGDPERLGRAIANVLGNALKWSPEGGSVEVRVSRGAVVIRDHGPGIDEADLPLVFERFYRAPTARGTPGSGLGLAIVRHVVEAHGGSAEAGNAPGGGAVLTLRLRTV